MGSEQHYSLRWNDYTVKIVTAFQSLRDEEDFVDVTVACDGHSYSAHKMVLSACSPYFRALLRANPCQHPIVILKDVGHVELERLLEFMYNGEVSIAQDQLAAFLKTAENLKIRGLAGSSDDLDQAGIHRPDVSYSYSGGGATSGRSSPSAGYAPSQGSKDDDIAGEGGGGGGGGVSGGGGGGGGGSSSYHTRPDSPPAKRRKRSSAPASSHTDPNTTTHTSEGVGEALVEGIEGGGSLSSAGLPGDDELRLDRREMKSEPGDSLTEVYSESSDMSTDPHSHSGEGMDHRQPVLYPIAMAGPSGSVGSQDGVGTHEPGGSGEEARGVLKQEEGAGGEEEVLELWWGESGVDLGPEPLPQPPPQPPPSQQQQQPSQPQQPTQGTMEECGWGPFNPLSHLETLTHSTFGGKGDAMHSAGIGGMSGNMEGMVGVGGSVGGVGGGLEGVQSTMGSGVVDMPGNRTQNYPWFPCTQCGKSFRTRVTLSRHVKIHKGNAFPCPVCPKVFYQVSNVKYHVHAVHGRQYEPPVKSFEAPRQAQADNAAV